MFRKISRTVWVLSLVSLFTDISSEMLYPVMPLYLKSIGFSIVLIGFLEGLAEAVAGLSKIYFGKESDIRGKRLPFVQLGYLLSAFSKPMMAAFAVPLWVFAARTLDRLGKGVRTGARDALLSQEATPQTKATVFGFHRALDTLGASIGPLAALLYLQKYPEDYKNLFYIAFIPGLLSVSITLLVKERKSPPGNVSTKPSFFSIIGYMWVSTVAYRKLVAGLLAFTLFNSSDIFLLLMLKQHGLSDMDLIRVYIFYNLVYALLAYPAGMLADRFGLKKMFIIGLLLFVVVYLGMALNNHLLIFYLLFFLYGMYAAFTEGISKAWISLVCEQKDMGTAIGTYEGFRSIVTLLASMAAGIIWNYAGATTTFFVTAAGVSLVCIYFLRLKYLVSKT